MWLERSKLILALFHSLLFAILQTIINNIDDGCTISLPLVAAITIVSMVIAVIVTHQPDYRSSKARRVHSA